MQSQQLPQGRMRTPARLPWHPWPCWVAQPSWGKSVQAHSQPLGRARGFGVPHAPPPASVGSWGGKSWGEPGFRLEPQLPVQPPRGRKQGPGEASSGLPAPSPGRAGMGSEGEVGARRGAETTPYPGARSVLFWVSQVGLRVPGRVCLCLHVCLCICVSTCVCAYMRLNMIARWGCRLVGYI